MRYALLICTDESADTALSPDMRTIYIATDNGGIAESLRGGVTSRMQNPGAILAFTYVGPGETQTGSEAAGKP